MIPWLRPEDRAGGLSARRNGARRPERPAVRRRRSVPGPPARRLPARDLSVVLRRSAHPLVVAGSARGAAARASSTSRAAWRAAMRNRGYAIIDRPRRLPRWFRSCGDRTLRPEGTWITPAMREAYEQLHELGLCAFGRDLAGRRASWAASTASRSAACSSVNRCSAWRAMPRKSRMARPGRGVDEPRLRAARLPDPERTPREPRGAHHAPSAFRRRCCDSGSDEPAAPPTTWRTHVELPLRSALCRIRATSRSGMRVHGKGRRNSDGRQGRRDPAEHHVPRAVAERPHRHRAHLGQDAQELHPHPHRRRGHRGDDARTTCRRAASSTAAADAAPHFRRSGAAFLGRARLDLERRRRARPRRRRDRPSRAGRTGAPRRAAA